MSFRDLFSQLRSLVAESSKLQISAYRGNNNYVSNLEISLVDYKNIVKNSLKIWENIFPSLTLCRGKNFSVNDLAKAKSYLINSYSLSLSTKGNPYYTCAGIYDTVNDKNNKPIYGCKWHISDSTLHLEGLLLSGEILSPGHPSFPENSSLTLAKDWLRSRTPLARWRQFKLSPNQFKQVRAIKLSLSDCDMIRHCITITNC